jgi:predicted PurR-regulated permease PerM
MDKQISIATNVAIRVILVLLGLWFLYLVGDIVALFLLSVILTATLDPAIDWMAKRKIPRPFGVFIIYVAIVLFVVLLISFLIPPLVSQFKDFAEKLPVYSGALADTFTGIERYANSYGIQFQSGEFLQNAISNFFQSSGQVFSTTASVFSFFISLLVIFALTFYMSVKEDGMNSFLVSLTPKAHKDHVVIVANRIKKKIGRWLGGQLLLMLIIFALDFIALSIFRVPYALILALFAGLLEIVPYLGPIISVALASIVGFFISPVTGLIILGILTVIQQLESHVIAPQLMKKVVGLNPVVVILALLIGAKLGGTLGAILAIPLATSAGVLISDLFYKNTEEEREI